MRSVVIEPNETDTPRTHKDRKVHRLKTGVGPVADLVEIEHASRLGVHQVHPVLLP